MGVVDDLASAYAEREVTVPVQCGGAVTRAFFNVAGSVVKVGGVPLQVEHDTLIIQRGALNPDLEQEAKVQVGQLGAETVATNDPIYTASQITPLADGLETTIALEGGPA